MKTIEEKARLYSIEQCPFCFTVSCKEGCSIWISGGGGCQWYEPTTEKRDRSKKGYIDGYNAALSDMGNNEHIISSAIHYDDGQDYIHQNQYGVETGYVVCGFRHHHIIEVRGRDLNVKKTQGFVTSKGRFVNRKEAAKIACKANQVGGDTDMKILYSEDIWL